MNNVWRWVIHNSLEPLLDTAGTCSASRLNVDNVLSACASDINQLLLISRVMLRIAILPFDSPNNLVATVVHAARSLRSCEDNLQYTLIEDEVANKSEQNLPPHTSQHIHTLYSLPPFTAWGKTVENLWQVSMACTDRNPSWNDLSCRLLFWRSIAGSHQSPAGEWLRQEILATR